MPELNLQQILARRQDISRKRYTAQVTQAEAALDAQSNMSGVNLGWDADSGRRRIGLPGGRVLLAKDITNGAIAQGSQVMVSTAKGSLDPTVDAMPN